VEGMINDSMKAHWRSAAESTRNLDPKRMAEGIAQPKVRTAADYEEVWRKASNHAADLGEVEAAADALAVAEAWGRTRVWLEGRSK
jgi:hypothetical protein